MNKKNVVNFQKGALWLFILFLMAGAGASFTGVRMILFGIVSGGWPATEGVVVSSDLDFSRSGSRMGDSQVSADISYMYHLEGKKYQSDRICFGFSNPIFNHADKLVRKYPRKKQISVYYNPNNPEQAVLEPGISFGAVLITLVGIFFLALGVLPFLREKTEKSEKFSKLPTYAD